MKAKRDEGYCRGCAKLYRKCAGFYAYPNPECYVKKAKPDSYAYLIELEKNLKKKLSYESKRVKLQRPYDW